VGCTRVALHLHQLFADDPKRGERMAVEAAGLCLDYSKNRVTDTGSIPIVASMTAGLPATAVLGLGAGLLTIEAAIETWREVRTHHKNGLSFLLGKAAAY